MRARLVNTASSSSNRCSRIPRVAILTDTAIAVILCSAGIYHFTQPNQAWRSGTIEVACASALMAAACLLGRTKAMLIQVAVALGIGAPGRCRRQPWRYRIPPSQGQGPATSPRVLRQHPPSQFATAPEEHRYTAAYRRSKREESRGTPQ
jgi:hypothetical protein